MSAASQRLYLFTQISALILLILTLLLGLLPALLAGLLIYQLTNFGAGHLSRTGLSPVVSKSILLAFIAFSIIASIAIGMSVLASTISDGPESLVVLMQKMADVIDVGRSYLPAWIQAYLPASIEEWQNAAGAWLRDNARHVSLIGLDVGIFLIHIILGMILGGMIALNPSFQGKVRAPLAHAISERVHFLGMAFRRVVFSQIRISALNTLLTGIFLAAIMPSIGVTLPFVKQMIVVTFIAGLLPIIGNLISNTVIVLISLSVSPLAAAGSLTFLVVIHKLEYFINARIIGSQIRAKAWEILISMIAMEALFGVAGVVAAPIYYAYIKDELSEQKLI